MFKAKGKAKEKKDTIRRYVLIPIDHQHNILDSHFCEYYIEKGEIINDDRSWKKVLIREEIMVFPETLVFLRRNDAQNKLDELNRKNLYETMQKVSRLEDKISAMRKSLMI